jgi:hypothetical protein
LAFSLGRLVRKIATARGRDPAADQLPGAPIGLLFCENEKTLELGEAAKRGDVISLFPLAE